MRVKSFDGDVDLTGVPKGLYDTTFPKAFISIFSVDKFKEIHITIFVTCTVDLVGKGH